MGSFSLTTSHFCFPKHSNLCTTTPNPPHILLPPKKVISQLKHPKHLSPSSQNLMITKQKQSSIHKSLILETENGNTFLLSGGSVILGAVSIGLVMLLFGVDDHKAMAMGPEGPLVEEFWDNMRRYGLYILTVSTGVAYTILEPILELLRNPITAILIVVIFGGSFYIVSQVLSAMVGVSEFNYQYGY